MQRPNSSFVTKPSISSYAPISRDSDETRPFRNVKSKFSIPQKSTKTILIGISLISFLFLFLFFAVSRKSRPISASIGGYDLSKADYFRFVIVADLDRMSKDLESKKSRWRSILKFGIVHFDAQENQWSVGFDYHETYDIYSYFGEADRGMELSELLFFQDKLLAFDDRSGIAFEITEDNQPVTKDSPLSTVSSFACIPRFVLTEGDGYSPKGQKTEWATLKDDEMFVGSFGKEFTLTDGSIAHKKNLWINLISSKGDISHLNWKKVYDKLRNITRTQHPGYMIHEAVNFNRYKREWVFLPRRVSHQAYDEKLDELKGSNLIIRANEDFTDFHVTTVGGIVPERGFSSFKFLPKSEGKIILALKTVEKEDKLTGESEQTSFITMFDLEGKVIIEDIEIPGDAKFEGLEFL